MSKINDFLDENSDKLFDDDFLLETLGCYPYAENIFGVDDKKDATESHEKEHSQTTSSSSGDLEPLRAATVSQGKLQSASATFSTEEAPTQSCTGDKTSTTTTLEDDLAGHFQSTHILDPDEFDEMLFPEDILWNPRMTNNYSGLFGFGETDKGPFGVDYEVSDDDSVGSGEDISEDSEEDSCSSEYSYSSDETSSSSSSGMEVETIDMSSALTGELAGNDSTEVIEVRAPSIQDGGLYQIECSTHTPKGNIRNDFVNKEEIEKYAKHAKWTRTRNRRRKREDEKTATELVISNTMGKMTTKLQEEAESEEKSAKKSDEDDSKEKAKPRTRKKGPKKKQASTASTPTSSGRKRERKRKTKTETRKEGDRAKEVLEEMAEKKASEVRGSTTEMQLRASSTTHLLLPLSHQHTSSRGKKGSKKAQIKGPRERRLSTVVAEANAASEKTRNTAKMEYVYVKPSVYTNTEEHAAIKVDSCDEKESKEYTRRLFDEVKASARFVTQGYFINKGESNAEVPIAVVESHACNISRSIFVYPPRTHQGLELQRPEKPIEDKFPVIKPAAVRIGYDGVDYLLASALIVRRLRSNRIVLHKISHNEERCGNEWDVSSIGGDATGFTFKTRIADIKWLTTKILAVANGDTIKAVSVASAKPLPSVTAQRTSLHETECEWASRNDSPEQFPGGNTIRELDSKRSSQGLVFTGTENGSVMLYDIVSAYPLQRLLSSPVDSSTGSSPISSVRGDGLPEFVYSFTTDSGRICLCDRRMPWDKPALSADTNALVGDSFSSLWTHDWNPAVPGEVVLGYASRAVGTMAGLDIRFPACVLHARDYRSSVLPFDVHFADNCSRSEPRGSAAGSSTDWKGSTYALFGERNFGISNLHSNFDWFTPASEKEFNGSQVCVMGCFLERDTLLTVSDNADVKIWSILNL